MSFNIVLVKNPLMLRLGQGPLCHQVLTWCYHVLLQQGEILLAIYSLALCLNAVARDCHHPRCHAMLANATIRAYFVTLLLNGYLGWRFILEKHQVFVAWPLYWKTKSTCFCSQPHYAVTSVPIARRSIPVCACA